MIDFNPVDHTYRDSSGVEKPSVTWILNKAGLCDWSFVEAEIRERAMASGKSVHWMTRLEDEGCLNYRTVPISLRPFRKGYLGWKRGCGFFPQMIEEPFISPLGFAGTPDRVGTFPATEMFPRGSRGVVDLKTGAVYNWVRFQLLLYAVGVTKSLWEAKALRRIALALRADGTHQVKEFYRDTWDTDFAICMEAKKRVLEWSGEVR